MLASERSDSSPNAIENCYSHVLKQSFNDIDYALLGYHILQGYPLADGMDPGFAAPIFRADYSTKRVSADCRYSLPRGIYLYPQVACETSFSSQEIKTKKEFEDSFSSSVEASGSFFGATFSANSGYSKAASKIDTGESLLVISHAKCLYYKSRLNLKNPPPLDADFIRLVMQLLSATDKKEATYDFLDTYGTHFVTEVDFGARYTKQHEMTSSQYDKMSQSKFDVSAQASYSGAFSAGGGFNLDSEQRQAAMNFQQSVKTSTITVGATPPASGDEMEWASNVKLNPMPIRYKLKSIDKLFTSQFMPDLRGLTEARQAIVEHSQTYCSALSHRLGVEDICHVNYSGRPMLALLAMSDINFTTV